MVAAVASSVESGSSSPTAASSIALDSDPASANNNNNNNKNNNNGATSPTAMATEAATSSSSSSSNLLDNCSEWMPSLPVAQVTVTMYIPTNCVGAVIGRRGATIASIQKQAQTPNAPPVRVSIVGHAHSQPSPSDPLSPYNGVASSATAATAATMNTSPSKGILPPNNNGVQDGLASSSSPTAQASNVDPSSQHPSAEQSPSTVPYTYTPLDFSDPNWTPVVIRADPLAALTVAQKLEPLCNHGSLQDTIIDIPIGRQRHASIVGKRGLTLMQTSADTACRIWVPPKELKLDILQLEGQLPNCVSCLKAFHDILSNEKSQKATYQSQLIVPALPSQTKLRSVGRKTDTLVKKKKLADTDSWQLTVLGSNEAQVANAHAILAKWAEQQKGAPTTGDSTDTNSVNNDANTATSNHSNSSSQHGKPSGGSGRGGGRSGGGRGGRGGNSGRGGGGGRGRKGKGRGGGGPGRGNAGGAFSSAPSE